MTLPLCNPGQTDFWLGNPPSLIKLVQPDEYYTNHLDAGEVDHPLISGGHHIQRVGKLRRTYGLTFAARLISDADQIASIQYGMLGPGPYYFIDPLWPNVLAGHVSGTGRRLQNTQGLQPTVGTVAYSAAIAPPTIASGIAPGVQTWTGAGSASVLYLGASTTAGVLETDAPPAQQNALPIAPGLWVKAVSGTPSVSLAVNFNDTTGAVLTSTTVATLTLSTVWQRISGSVTAAAIPATAVTFGLKLICNTAAAPVIHLSAAYAQYAIPAAGQVLPAWVLGLGVPRVELSGGMPSNHAKAARRRTQALNLVEA